MHPLLHQYPEDAVGYLKCKYIYHHNKSYLEGVIVVVLVLLLQCYSSGCCEEKMNRKLSWYKQEIPTVVPTTSSDVPHINCAIILLITA
jgi:hypothetical protein